MIRDEDIEKLGDILLRVSASLTDLQEQLNKAKEIYEYWRVKVWRK